MKDKSYTSGAMNDYTSLVNQGGFLDAAADPLIAQGVNGSSKHQGDRETNAVLAGFGSGMKGVANQQRMTKLAEMEEITKQIAMLEAGFKVQIGQEQLREAELFNFTGKYQREFISLADAMKAGDQKMVNKITGDLVNAASRDITGFKERFGNFSHAYDGYVYFNKDGEASGVSFKQLFSDIPAAKVMGAKANSITPLLNEYEVKKLEQTNFFEQQAMDEARLKNAELGSRIGVNNAHANLYNTQAAGEMQSMQNPSPYPKPVLENIQKTNVEWVNGLAKEHKQLDREAKAYERIAELIQKNASTWGSAGSNLFAQARQYMEAKTGADRDRQLVEMNKQPLMRGIKEIFAGSTSDKDTVTFLAGTPDFDKNPEAAIMIAKERATEIRQRLKQENLTREVLEREYNYSQPYNSLAVQQKVQEMMANQGGQSQSAQSNNNDLSDLE